MGNLKNKQKRIGKPGRRKRLTQQLVDYWTRRKEEINNPRPPEIKTKVKVTVTPAPPPSLNLVGTVKVKNKNLDSCCFLEKKTESEKNQAKDILEYIKLCDKKKLPAMLGDETTEISEEVKVDSNCDKDKSSGRKQRSRKMLNPRRRIHPQLNILQQLLKKEPGDVIIVKEEIEDEEEFY